MIFSMIGAMMLEASVPVSDYTFLDRAEAEHRARSCGLREIATESVEVEQQDYLTISDAEITEEQLSCLAMAFDATNFFVLVPEAYSATYYGLVDEIAAPRARAIARRELARLGYGKPPQFNPTANTDSEFALVLEQFCGPAAVGALGSEWGPRTLAPTFFKSPDMRDEEQMRAVGCLIMASSLSGYTIGFIGNEKLPDAELPSP